MYKYATKVEEKHAKAVGIGLPVSTKHCVEISNYIRGRRLEDAITLLEQVVAKKHAIPFKRHLRDLPHKPGIGPGRYPEKASLEIINLLKSASANAQHKGMGVSNLYIKHICAHLASRPWHYGRQTRRKMKRTHLEVVLEEREVKRKKVEQVKETKPKEAKEKTNVAEPKTEKPKVELKTDKTEPKLKIEKPKEEMVKEPKVEPKTEKSKAETDKTKTEPKLKVDKLETKPIEEKK